MLDRFSGDAGRRLRIDALARQKIVGGNAALAEELADNVEVQLVQAGTPLIVQDGIDNDLFLIFSGRFDIVINGRKINERLAGEHVGEMAAIEPAQKRSATVLAREDSVVAKLSEANFSALGSRYPDMFRYIARELARRLHQRDSLIRPIRDRVKLFVVSSVEALPIARLIQSAFGHDQFVTTVWTDGVFKVAHYPLESLEIQVEASDFAIAIAHGEDMTESRGKIWPSPRDNVILELGLFMGHLGRKRAILMEPRDHEVKLPSDMAGLTTIPYRFEPGADEAALIAPACNALRDHIIELGAR